MARLVPVLLIYFGKGTNDQTGYSFTCFLVKEQMTRLVTVLPVFGKGTNDQAGYSFTCSW